MTKESIFLKQHKYVPGGVIRTGVASAAGAANTFVDTDIPAAYIADIFKDERLFIYAGTGAGQTRKISAYNDVTGTFTLYDNWTTNPDTDSRYQVVAGDGIAAAVAAAGLVYYGEVTTANSDVNFKVAGLARKGTNVFNDVYYCQVIEADNAAPEGEIQKVSAYDTSDGDITVGAAFSADPAVGDQVLIIHESLALLFMHADAMLARVVDDSIIAHILAVDGDVSDYNDNTMSLEALNIDLDALIVSLALVPQSGGAVSWNATALTAIQTQCTGAIAADDLDHLLELDGAAQKYPENCATDSIIAKLIAKGDPAVPSTYDCTTDSLEAISDAIAAISVSAIRSSQLLELGRLQFTIDSAAGDQTIISGVTPSHVIQTTDANVDQVLLHIHWSINNTYDGANSLARTNGENYLKVANVGADTNVHQYVNGDWAMLSISESRVIHQVFDITDIVTDVDGTYTVKLVNADAAQDSLAVYAEVWLEVVFHP